MPRPRILLSVALLVCLACSAGKSSPSGSTDGADPVVLRLDVGSATAFVDTAGKTWEADRGYLGRDDDALDHGENAVSGTSNPRLYQTERRWPLGYEIPIANGRYTVRLHLAEWSATAAGQRVIRVRAEDREFGPFDAFAEKGARAAVVETLTSIDVADGALSLRFLHDGDEPPALAALEVLRETAPVPTCADGAMNGSETGVDCGGSCAACPTVDVKALVEDAVAKHLPSVRIPPGTHRVGDKIKVEDGRGIVIDGTGATLLFTHGGTAFSITKSGATLRGVTVDYDPVVFTQGTVVELGPRNSDSGGSYLRLALADGYPAASAFAKPSGAHVYLFDAAGRFRFRLWAGKIEVGASDREVRLVSIEGGQAYGALRVGDRIALVNRTTTPAIQYTTGSGEVRLERVTIRGASGVAVYCQRWDGPSTLEWLRIERGPVPPGATEPRLMAANMDALHSTLCRQGPRVLGADIGWAGDDGANFHGELATVVSQDALALRVQTHATWHDLATMARAGDVVRVEAPGSLAVKGEARLASAARVSGQTQDFLVTLEAGSTLSASPGDIVELPALNGPGAVIRDSDFHDSAARGVVLKGSRDVVEGSRFENLNSAGIRVETDYDATHGWYEGGWTDDVLVRHNHLVGVAIRGSEGAIVSAGSASHPGHTGLRVEENRVEGVNGAGIFISAARNATVQHNRVSGATAVVTVDAASTSDVTLIDNQ